MHLNHHTALAQTNAQHYIPLLCSIYWWTKFPPCAVYKTHYLSIKEYDQQLSGVGLFTLPLKKKHAAVFACIFIIQTYINMYFSRKTTKQQISHLNLEGGWEEYCRRLSPGPHCTIPCQRNKNCVDGDFPPACQHQGSVSGI